MITIILTGAGGSAAENYLQSLRLSKLEIRVVGADIAPARLHLSSADERFVLPRLDDPNYLPALNSAISYYSADILHSQPDAEVTFVGRNREKITANLFLPSQQTLEIASDKAAFASRMSSRGVPVPESTDLESFGHLHDVVRSFRTRHDRLWLRARSGAGSRASLPIRTASQAAAWVQWWVEERGMSVTDFMISEMLPGREYAYQSIWQEGQLIAGQLRERLEYLYGFLSPSGQSSTPAVARTVSEPNVDDLAQDAIRALDEKPTGVYCVDIKTDASGQARVTEINAGRFFTTSNFFSAAGLNMPLMAVRAALGEDLPVIGSSPLEPDLYWVRMVDMGYALVHGNEINKWETFPK